MAQEYTVEQLNHGRKVWDFMRWDYWAFGISGFLLIVSIAIIGVRGFNWGLDFTGGTVIEITLEKPVDLDQMRDSLQKAGFEEPQVQNFGSSRDLMVRMPPVHDANGSQELGSKVVSVINDSTSQNATVKRIEFVGPSVGADLAQTGDGLERGALPGAVRADQGDPLTPAHCQRDITQQRPTIGQRVRHRRDIETNHDPKVSHV